MENTGETQKQYPVEFRLWGIHKIHSCAHSTCALTTQPIMCYQPPHPHPLLQLTIKHQAASSLPFTLANLQPDTHLHNTRNLFPNLKTPYLFYHLCMLYHCTGVKKNCCWFIKFIFVGMHEHVHVLTV